MNYLINAVYESGLSDIAYYIFHVLGFAAVLFFNLIYCRYYGITKKQTIVITAIVYSVSYIWIYILAWIENGFRNFGANNIVRGFIYMPVFAIAVAGVMKIGKKRITDFIAPCVVLSQGISHMGCIFPGCCYGIQFSIGYTRPGADTVRFPSQIVEALVALAIFALLIMYAKKRSFSGTGRVYPLFLILFGATRFLLEFLRDNEKLFANISSLALHAAFMVVVGVLWWDALIRIERKTERREKYRKRHLDQKSKKR